MRVKNNMCFDCQQLEMQCRCPVDNVGWPVGITSRPDVLEKQKQLTKLTKALLFSSISVSLYGNLDKEGWWKR